MQLILEIWLYILMVIQKWWMSNDVLEHIVAEYRRMV